MKLKFWEHLLTKDGFSEEPRLALWNANEEIHVFDKYAKLLTCPGCSQTKGFKLVDYERGSDGWELHMICTKCRVTAVLNNTGFRFARLIKEVKK
jgi:hypothetical protein